MSVEVKLGDVCRFLAGSAFPQAYQGAPSGWLPFIKVSDMNLAANEFCIRDAANWISEEVRAELKVRAMPVDATVFAKIGEALKHNRFRRLVVPTGIDNNMMAAIVIAPSTLDERFLSYLLPSLNLPSYSTGTSVPYLTVSVLTAISVALPPLNVQRRIATVLSAYDDLIENNTRRIAILEEMARRLYEEWFVHFRFPGYDTTLYSESSEGRLPDGWKRIGLREIVRRLKNGRVYKQSDVSSRGAVTVIDQSTSEYLGFHNNEPDHAASIDFPVIIFGDHTCKMQIMVTSFSLGPNTVAFDGAGRVPIFYLFALTRGSVATSEYKRHWGDLMSKEIVLGSLALAQEYDRLVRPMYGQIEILRRANRSLRSQRDILLPKLLSGEIDVSAAHAAVAAE